MQEWLEIQGDLFTEIQLSQVKSSDGIKRHISLLKSIQGGKNQGDLKVHIDICGMMTSWHGRTEVCYCAQLGPDI